MGLMKHLVLITGGSSTSEGGAGRAILKDERMAQQLRGGPPLSRVPLETTSNKIPELSRRRLRRLRGFRHTNGDHEGGPITLPANRKRKPSQIEFQYADAQAPYVTRIAVVLAVIQIGVDSLGAHVSNCTHGRIAGIHSLG